MLALLKDTDIHSLQDVPDIEQPTTGTFLLFVLVIFMTQIVQHRLIEN